MNLSLKKRLDLKLAVSLLLVLFIAFCFLILMNQRVHKGAVESVTKQVVTQLSSIDTSQFSEDDNVTFDEILVTIQTLSKTIGSTTLFKTMLLSFEVVIFCRLL